MKENAPEIDLFKKLFNKEERRLINHLRFKPFFGTYAGHGGPVRHTHPCFLLWNMLTVLWDGRAALCCMDYDARRVLGDLGRQSVREVWNAAPVQEMRARHRAGQTRGLSPCGTCDIPEQGYFNAAAILGSVAVSTPRVRRMMPAYEKLLLLKD